MSAMYTIPQLNRLIGGAKALGFHTDVAHYTAERAKLLAAQAAPTAAPTPVPTAAPPVAPPAPEPIPNPSLLGWPWSSPDGIRDDPGAIIEEEPCGCYLRVDAEVMLCATHLTELNKKE